MNKQMMYFNTLIGIGMNLKYLDMNLKISFESWFTF